MNEGEHALCETAGPISLKSVTRSHPISVARTEPRSVIDIQNLKIDSQ